MGERGDAWLQQGVDHIVEDSCPYCGQSVQALPLIEAYRKVFADAYREMKTAVERTRGSIERDFGDRAAGSLDMFFEANRGAAEFWSRYCRLPELASPHAVSKAVSDLGLAALALLAAKAAAPQEAVAPGPDFSAALAQFEAARAAVDGYNVAIAAANSEIDAKKAAVASGDMKKEELALARLNAQKKRHDPSMATLCSDHQRLVKEKDSLDEQKAQVRAKLEKHTNKVIKPYEGRINQLLDNFNAGFNIARTKPAYTGGVASSTYQIVINSTGIELGDSKTPADRASFKNTLSAGDRSTLALALFVAHLEHDPDCANKIVVFDDPFTSQDSFRRRQTIHEITRLGGACKQLIVFSHDAVFLRQIRDKCRAADCAVLQLADHRSLGVKIMLCNLDATCRGRAASDMDDLQGYVTSGAGKDRDIVRKMRIVLETYCRSTYSGSFAPDELLGEMIEKIRKTGDQHPAWALMDEIEQINEYSRDHHHGEDPEDGSADFIDATELTGFVRRTLRIANSLQA
jgi:wobble nucleotide-excising tRNase